MLTLLKIVVFLLVIGFVGLAGYAYLGDLEPTPVDSSEPVDLDAL
ncbi:hypothetical protein [Palleronia sediminis]|nr:hypothetical protein [Palleronia sediminis]